MNNLNELQTKKFRLRNNIRAMESVLVHKRMSKENRMKMRATIDKLQAELDDVSHTVKMLQ
jgi:hypothetical protein